MRRQSRLIRRLRLVLGGAVALLVLALVAGGTAAVQTDRAARNAERARAAALTAQEAAVAADARRLGVRAQLTDDISLSLLLAAAGARLDDSAETRANLLATMGEHPKLVRSVPPEGGYLEGLSVSPDGRWIVSSDDRNRVHLYDAATTRWRESYDVDPSSDEQQAFSYGRSARTALGWPSCSIPREQPNLSAYLTSTPWSQ